MHAKCSAVLILFPLILRANLVFSSEKIGQEVVSVHQHFGDNNDSDRDFLPTTDYAVTSFDATDEGPTSSSTRGYLIEDTSSFKPNGKAVFSSGSKLSNDAGTNKNASTGNEASEAFTTPRDNKNYDDIVNREKTNTSKVDAENWDLIHPYYVNADEISSNLQNNLTKIDADNGFEHSRYDSSNNENPTESDEELERNKNTKMENGDSTPNSYGIEEEKSRDSQIEANNQIEEKESSKTIEQSSTKLKDENENNEVSSMTILKSEFPESEPKKTRQGIDDNLLNEETVLSSTTFSESYANLTEEKQEAEDQRKISTTAPETGTDFLQKSDIVFSSTMSETNTNSNKKKEETSGTIVTNIRQENDSLRSTTTISESNTFSNEEKQEIGDDERLITTTEPDEEVNKGENGTSKIGTDILEKSDTAFSSTIRSGIDTNSRGIKKDIISTTLPDENILYNFSESENEATPNDGFGSETNNLNYEKKNIEDEDETIASTIIPDDNEFFSSTTTNDKEGKKDVALKDENSSKSEDVDAIFSSTTKSESVSILNVKKGMNIKDEEIERTTISYGTEATDIRTNDYTESTIFFSSTRDTFHKMNVSDIVTATNGSNFFNGKLKMSTSTLDVNDVTDAFSESTTEPYSTRYMQEVNSTQDMSSTIQYTKKKDETGNYGTTLHYQTSTASEMTVGYSIVTESPKLSSPDSMETTGVASTSTNHRTTEISSDTRKTNSVSSEIPTTAITFTTSSTTASGEIPYFCKGARITDYETTEGKTTLEINWKLEPKKIDDRCQLKINVSCDSLSDNFDWIVTHQESLTQVNDSEPISYLRNLSEYTNYSCIGELFIDSQDQPVLSTENFNVTTKKEVPSSVHVDIKNITDKSFYLEWKRPKKIPGNLQTYYILIKRKSIHFIRHECSTGSIEMTIPFSSDKENVSYHFPWVEPNHLYEVQILAQDEAGNSRGITQRGVTESSPSTEPLNVTTILHNYSNHCKGENYNATLQLNWELPCNTNGELAEFEVNITEVIYFDATFEYTGNSLVYRIPKNLDILNVNYQLIVENLNASCAYEASIVAVTGNDLHGVPARITSKRTVDGCPSQPTGIRVYVNDSSFSLEWKEPVPYYGKIEDYNVAITGYGPKHDLSRDPTCPKYPLVHLEEKTNKTYFTFNEAQPNFSYDFKIEARTSAGSGNSSKNKEVVTLSKESEPIRNLEITKVDEFISYDKYEYSVRISFQEPCNTNGQFRFYRIEEKGTRPGYPDVYYMMNVNRTSYERILRKPDYQYEFSVSVVTEMFVSATITKNLTTNAAVPMVNDDKIRCIVDDESPTILNVELKKGVFDEQNGEIIRYAIFLFEGVFENSNLPEPSFGFCSESCPLVNKTSYPYIRADHIYTVIDKKWNPFSDGKDEVMISIGEKDHCADQEFCLTLMEDTDYILLIRGITKNTYRDFIISIKTGISPSSASLLFISFILLLVAILLLGVYFYSRRPPFFTIRFRSIPNTVIEETSNLRYVVAVKSFVSYYNKIENDPSLLKKQYEEIDEEIKKYKEENVHTTFALKPENKRKNRYTNILPYDEYRVKLNIDEDDEISSDYINASYIKGVTGEIEYIATQGPLAHTCKDFWKMVIQENVTVIVMVSQFVEKEKEKCYKYFPKNHENMKICEDLEVKCLTELQFDTYCVRTLLIKKDIKQYSVIHMQYLDWPDFGCPTGTYNMISFCGEVRDRIQIEKGLMAVHCSAGVGRTGTLISLDILLQTLRREKEISVFECVIDLRKQRTHMVQTEKQYVYIHTCLKDVLENCSLYSFDQTKRNDEHIYENVWDNKVKGGHSEEKESAF